MIKSFIAVFLTATYAVSAHADDAPTYDNAAECIGMLEFLALLTPADHPMMGEIKKRVFGWADYAKAVKPGDKKTRLTDDANFTRDYLINVVRPQGNAALQKHVGPLQETCDVPPTAPLSNPFELTAPTAQEIFTKAVECAGVYQLSVDFGDDGAALKRKAFTKLALSANASIQAEELEAMVAEQNKAHVTMMIAENAKSVEVAQMCKNAVKNMHED